MCSIDGSPVVEHVVNRVRKANNVDKTVIATSTEPQDNVTRDTGERIGVDVIRGSEADVLQRFQVAVEKYTPEVILRVTADCPLISPSVIEYAVNQLEGTDADYTSNTFTRTFPRGLDIEAFTVKSFLYMAEKATGSHYKEHVTPYYREHPDQFELQEITSEEVFEEDQMQGRTDLRLTLDEPADYKLLQQIYEEIEYEEILSVRSAIRYIDREGLQNINAHIEQKSVKQ